MPVYEFVCKRCSEAFEELVLGREEVRCPACRSRELEKRFSSFAAPADGRRGSPVPPPGSCGSCGDPRGPGACRED